MINVGGGRAVTKGEGARDAGWNTMVVDEGFCVCDAVQTIDVSGVVLSDTPGGA